jgi:hypothetical protein
MLIPFYEQKLTLPLKRLSLRLYFAFPEDRVSERNFSPKNFTELLRLLARTQLERLELTSLNWIPTLLEVHSVASLKLLRLSGSCRFEEEVRLPQDHVVCNVALTLFH